MLLFLWWGRNIAIYTLPKILLLLVVELAAPDKRKQISILILWIFLLKENMSLVISRAKLYYKTECLYFILKAKEGFELLIKFKIATSQIRSCIQKWSIRPSVRSRRIRIDWKASKLRTFRSRLCLGKRARQLSRKTANKWIYIMFNWIC